MAEILLRGGTVLDGTGSDGPGGSVSDVIGAAFKVKPDLRAVDKPAF